MTSYFDDHNCEPLAQGQTPNHFIQIARLLIDGGWAEDMGIDFEHLFPDRQVAPPAAKEVVEKLPRFKATKEDHCHQQCPVCLKEFEKDIECIKMPCKHFYHSSCILTWLNKTNSCPICREELSTDDEHYEELQRQKKCRAERERNIEELHDSMFS